MNLGPKSKSPQFSCSTFSRREPSDISGTGLYGPDDPTNSVKAQKATQSSSLSSSFPHPPIRCLKDGAVLYVWHLTDIISLWSFFSTCYRFQQRQNFLSTSGVKKQRTIGDIWSSHFYSLDVHAVTSTNSVKAPPPLTPSSLLLLPAGLWHFSMPYLRVILQVKGHDGMSTLQNGAAKSSEGKKTSNTFVYNISATAM